MQEFRFEEGGSSPARERPSPGIVLIQDITSLTACPGVDTSEGRIGPLLVGQGCETYYIEVPPGSFISEHVHPRGAMVFTVKGNWVLCSSGTRRLMGPGSLFMYEDGAPVGVEVPFEEGAFLLTFRDTLSIRSDDQFRDTLLRFNERQGNVGEGMMDLPWDHPASAFGRSLGQVGKVIHPDGRS